MWTRTRTEFLRQPLVPKRKVGRPPKLTGSCLVIKICRRLATYGGGLENSPGSNLNKRRDLGTPTIELQLFLIFHNFFKFSLHFCSSFLQFPLFFVHCPQQTFPGYRQFLEFNGGRDGVHFSSIVSLRMMIPLTGPPFSHAFSSSVIFSFSFYFHSFFFVFLHFIILLSNIQRLFGTCKNSELYMERL